MWGRNKKLGIRSEELGIKKIMVSYSDFLTKIYSSFLIPHSSFELPAPPCPLLLLLD
jgi:hypothetical protein